MCGCARGDSTHRNGDIEILRFERTLFEQQGSSLATALAKFKSEYDSPLLSIWPGDERYMALTTDFVSDSVVRTIYAITEERYGDLGWLERDLTEALKRAAKVDEEIRFEHFATYVSAMMDYTGRVAADRESGSVLVSIDQYAVGAMGEYDYFGLPLYLVELSDRAYLASDIMAEIARQFIAAPEERNATMLDFMVMEGKVLWFLDEVMPDKAGWQKIRYTEEQWDWMVKNESNVWGYFIQHNLLYEKDFNRYHNFVDEAPKTNAFSNSAPRTTDYIGWQIVRSYMKRNKVSAQELFANSNSQAILQGSGYKP